MKAHLISSLASLLVAAVSAAAQPASDIYVAKLYAEDGDWRIDAPRNITNRATGYDNQPHFTPDGRSLLFTSIREDGQADTYIYDLASGETRRVTRTPESEYSPTPMPRGDGFSVVRVEADSSQRLWTFDAAVGKATLLLSGVEPVGYHTWVDSTSVALFVLGTPPSLRLADIESGSIRVMVESIGRSLHMIPGSRDLAFVHKESDEEWWIKALNTESGAIRRLVETLPESEDFAATPGGTILMARGPTVFAWDGGEGGEWHPIADLSGSAISRITRIAVAPDGSRVAFVSVHDTEG